MNNGTCTGVTTASPPVTTLAYAPCCQNNGSVVGESPSTLEVPGLFLATNFPLSLRAGSSCYMPCSPFPDSISILKSCSSVNVSTSILSNNSTGGFHPKRSRQVGGPGETKQRAGRRALMPLVNCCYGNWMIQSNIVHNWFLVGLEMLVTVSFFSCHKIYSCYQETGIIVWKAKFFADSRCQLLYTFTTSNFTCAIITLVLWYPMNTTTYMNWSTCRWWHF